MMLTPQAVDGPSLYIPTEASSISSHNSSGKYEYYFYVNSSMTNVTNPFRGNPLEKSYISNQLLAALKEINALSSMANGQDAFDFDRPSPDAIKIGRDLARELEYFGELPSRISASAEGGVVFGFRKNNRYAGIEISNDGEIVGLISDYNGKIEAWEVDQSALKETVNRVSEHLNA